MRSHFGLIFAGHSLRTSGKKRAVHALEKVRDSHRSLAVRNFMSVCCLLSFQLIFIDSPGHTLGCRVLHIQSLCPLQANGLTHIWKQRISPNHKLVSSEKLQLQAIVSTCIQILTAASFCHLKRRADTVVNQGRYDGEHVYQKVLDN